MLRNNTQYYITDLLFSVCVLKEKFSGCLLQNLEYNDKNSGNLFQILFDKSSCENEITFKSKIYFDNINI